MEPTASDPEGQMLGFFGQLPVLRRTHDTFDTAQYFPAPDDWALVVTDVVDSTSAVAKGQHKTVNFVAAMANCQMSSV